MEVLKHYYEQKFPYEWVIKFLTCDGKYPLNRREFSFTFKHGEVVLRHKKHYNVSDATYFMERYGYAEENTNLKDVPLRMGHEKAFKHYLTTNVPESINVGPLYDSIFEKKGALAPIVFDIDLKDYTQRTCCTGKKTCDRCWIDYGRPALRDLLKWLKEFMLFKHVLAVDSGSGGFHVYVLDERVWTWDKDARRQFYSFTPKSVIMDKSIANDFKHLVKIPYSPNYKNGCLSLPIENIEDYLPSRDRVKLWDPEEGVPGAEGPVGFSQK